MEYRNERKVKKSKKSKKRSSSNSSQEEEFYRCTGCGPNMNTHSYGHQSTRGGCMCNTQTSHCGCYTRPARKVRSHSVARVESLPISDYHYSHSYVPTRTRVYYNDDMCLGYTGYSGYNRYPASYGCSCALSSCGCGVGGSYGYGLGRSYLGSYRSSYPYYSGYYGSGNYYGRNYNTSAYGYSGYSGMSRYHDDYYTPYWRSYSPYNGRYSSYLHSGTNYNDGYYEGLKDSTLGYRRRYYL